MRHTSFQGVVCFSGVTMNNYQMISNSQIRSGKSARKRVYMLAGLISGFALLIFLATLLVSAQSLNTSVTSSTKVLAQAKPTAKTVNAGGAQQKSTAPQQSAVVATTVSKCTPSGLSANTAVPTLNPSANGMTDAGTKTSYYTVFGNTKSQIAGQIHSCSPVVSGGARYAASTDYVINWTFQFQNDATGNCLITTANVGVGIGTILPSWQSTPTTSAGTPASWNTFIANLDRHEEGHASLDRQYAGQILNMLQNFPLTSCDNIQSDANARAKAIVTQLDQANEQYDAITQHGTTQGATL